MSKPDIPAAAEHIAGRPLFHVVCHDCIMEAVHPDLRTAAGEHRAHLQAHPDHEVTVGQLEEGDER